MKEKKRGLYFEEFEIEDKFVSVGRTITESDIVIFAGLSGDYNPIHTDTEFAQSTIFGERIAHGFLGLTVVSGLAARLGFADGTTIALRSIDWKFRLPVRIGDSIHGVFIVNEKRELAGQDGGLVMFNVEVINQKGEKVQTGRWVSVIKKKE